MEAFFKKYPQKFTEKTAMKMIHSALHCAKKKMEKKDPTYMKDMVMAYNMICDYFQEKGINPDNYPTH
jgi:hypothetical protein